MNSFYDGQKWGLEMAVDQTNAFLSQNVNPDSSSFNSLSLESFPENGKCCLLVSQGAVSRVNLIALWEVRRDMDYLADRFYVSADEKISCQQMLFFVETERLTPEDNHLEALEVA